MEAPRPTPAAIVSTLAGIALLALLVIAIEPLRDAATAAIRGDSAEVRDSLDSLGVAGPLLIVALAVMHSFVWYPAEIIDAAAGFLYGFFPALGLAMAGWMLSGLICFAIGRSLARPLLDRWFGQERFPTWRFVWTTAIGYLPITALAVYFGTKLEGLSLTDPIVLGTAAALLVLLFVGHRIARRPGVSAASSPPVTSSRSASSSSRPGS
jgi:uncharacterized membrane protein YdjX (TVP38/TMEM64 family)